MKIIIYQNREVYKEESKIGNDSENKVETLEFEFPEEYRDFTKYIEFQIKGEKYVDLIEDNKYVITREVAKYGKIKTQVVLKKNTENDVMIFKSDVFTLTVSNSINATENLIYTVGVDLIEKIVTKNNEQDARLDTLEADNTTNKENISNLQNDNTTNKTNIKSLQDDNEVNKTDISNIKQEQTTQNTNISNLQTDNTSNKSKIEALETKNTQQDTNIQKNTDDIAEINAKDTTQDSLIEELQTKVVNLEAENTSLKNQIPQGEATGNPIHLTDSSDLECEIAVVGNSEQETGDVTDEEGNVIGASPSPDYPSPVVTVGQNGSVEIEVCNKNFINMEYKKTSWSGASVETEKNKIKFVGNQDGQLGLSYSTEKNSLNLKAGTKISYSSQYIQGELTAGNTYYNLELYYTDGTKELINMSRSTSSFKNDMLVEKVLPKDVAEFLISGSGYEIKGLTTDLIYEFQLEVGNATNIIEHESYTKVLPIQKEMLDEDYISDKEYHNWEKIDSYNGEEITTDFKSTTGELTTGATVYYKLAEPKELELIEEQKSVLNSFYTYKGITNISADGIATLKVNYKKDLETIINNLSATSVAE